MGVDTSESEEEAEDQADLVGQQIERNRLTTTQIARQAVSAESYGNYNQKKPFQPKVIAKDPTTQNTLKGLLAKSILF